MLIKKIISITFIFVFSISFVVNAQWGHALHFNWEERDRVEVLDAPYIWPSTMITGTIEMWFKPDTILAWNTHGPDYTWLFAKNLSGSNVGDLGLCWRRHDCRILWFVENGEIQSECLTDSTLIPFFEPRWYHVAGTWDVNTGMQIFVDGIMQPEKGSTDALPVTTGEQIFVIGNGSIDHFDDRYEAFRGSIDEFRISTVVRYTDDFDIPAEPFEVDINTLALWHFDEGQGVFAFDETGNGFDGHLGGHNEGPFVTVDTVLTKPDWVIVVETKVDQGNQTKPHDFFLSQNYPNPFNSNTKIEYSIPNSAEVRLTIYDLKGREIITLVETNQRAGQHLVAWNGRDQFGNLVASGIYTYRLEAGNIVNSCKLLFLK